MNTIVYSAALLGLSGVAWWWQQKKLKESGGLDGLSAAADRSTFGLVEDEAVAKRWDAMFYLGKLVPETMPGLGESVANFLTNTYVRGRLIRIALTTHGRVVFALEPDREDAPSGLAAMRDPSSSLSNGFTPELVYSASNPPRFVPGEALFSGHEAWRATVKDAPGANFDLRNSAAASRKMVVARLDNASGGGPWYVWIDPEAMQFLSGWAHG